MDSCETHLDFDSEPQEFRIRSHTWPQRPSREQEPQNSPVGDDSSSGDQQSGVKDPLGLTAKKSGSRRNAWGNLSYADLITKAIQNSPEKRLTLSQIYDWMVQNVPYFKDKGDSTSSAGWKNSIRHNLSLHSRFMRIQNEGTGKSSWWVLNPDAKPGKTPRRRTGSMEAKCFKEKRGRIRKKVDALRAGLENGTLSPGGCDDYLDNLSFGDFRQRTGSTASTNSRLSPITAVVEPDLGSGDLQPMSSIPWGPEVSNSPTLYTDNVYSDLVESLGEIMTLSNHDNLKMDMGSGVNGSYISDSSSDYSQPSSYGGVSQSSPGLDSQYTQMAAPPPYPKQQQQHLSGIDYRLQNFNTPQNFNSSLRLQIGPSPLSNGSTPFTTSELYNGDYSDSVLGIKQETLSPVHSLSVNTQQLTCSEQGSPNSGSFSHHSPQPQPGHQSQAVHGNGLPPHGCQVSPQQNRHNIQQQPVTTASLQQQALHQATCDSKLREALTRGALAYRNHTGNTSSTAFSLGNQSSLGCAPLTCIMNNGLPGIGLSSNPSLHHQTLTSAHLRGISENFTDHTFTLNGTGGSSSCNLGVPLDIDMELMGISVLDYDMEQVMEQVIKQELTLEGNLDFIFESGSTAPVSQNVVH